jgi:hypothetical protein
MKKVNVGLALRDRLGEPGSQGLTEYVERQGEVWRDDVVNTCTERMDGRWHDYQRHVDEKFDTVGDRLTRIVSQLADMRVEILRWTFAFWVGQVLTLIALMTFFFRSMTP